jgi:PAS domain S-box-containing protein
MTRRLASALGWLMLVTALFAVSAWAGLALTRELGRVAPIWLSNALLLSALLLSTRDRWPWLIGATFIVNVAMNHSIGDSMAASLGLAIANTSETLIAALLLHRPLRGSPDIVDPQVLLRFFAIAVTLAPAVSGAIAATILLLTVDFPFFDSLFRWWAADALGMAIVVPLALAIRPSELLESMRTQNALQTFGPFALLLLVSILVFGQDEYPILFLLFPPLLLVAFRMGFAATAIAISIYAAIAVAFTSAGFGPFASTGTEESADQIVVLQLLLAILILTSYPVCAVVAAQAKALRDVATSEERFRALAANSHDIIALTDMKGIWRYMSPAVTKVFGWHSEDLIGKDGMEFVHIEDAPLYRQGIQALMNGREVLSGSFRMRRRDGVYVWVETISRALRDAQGKQTGWVSNTRDISARKRVEQLKNEFISTVSHELRTPLTAMLGAVGLAATGKFGDVTPGLQKLLDMAKANGDRLSTLVNDILDFEKVSSGKMQFDLRSHSVELLLDQAVAAIRPYAAQHGVTVVRGSSANHTFINVDAGRFQQIMSNLLSNAAKFSESGDVVEVSATVTDERCRISVIDRGCGIPAEFRTTLFDRFAQADASDGRRRGGTGLGMAIAKHFTEQMRGAIFFESEENVGTTFHIEFPLAP